MLFKLNVLIATSGRPQKLIATLQSLARCSKPPSFDRVTVVENGTQQVAREALASSRIPLAVEYLHHPKAHKSAALNLGIQRIGQGLVVFLDDDLDCDAALLSAYASAAFDKTADAYYGGVVTPRFEVSLPPSWLISFLPYSVNGVDYAEHRRDGTLPFFLGANWAAFAEDIVRAGGFNPSLGPGSRPRASGEEAHMQQRLRDFGLRPIFVPDANVTHFVSEDKVTASWALKKAYWRGVGEGLVFADGRLPITGHLSKLFKHVLRFCVAILLGRSRETRFGAAWNAARELGIAKGLAFHRFRTLVKRAEQGRLITSLVSRVFNFARRHGPSLLKWVPYYGNRRHCPVCRTSSPWFRTYGAIPRKEAQCMHCGALERHRLLMLFLRARTNLFDGTPRKMLHVAPEPCLVPIFKRHLGNDYLSADLLDSNAMVKMDITNIQCPDESFDVIYCSHVLEHVQDDRKAMREFFRVLKDSGWAILLVPITAERTIEDPSIVDPQERLKIFGQADHVRRYGPDYVDRLREAGFSVASTKITDLVSPREAVRLGLAAGNREIYYCTK